jgi:hypothetical protein
MSSSKAKQSLQNSQVTNSVANTGNQSFQNSQVTNSVNQSFQNSQINNTGNQSFQNSQVSNSVANTGNINTMNFDVNNVPSDSSDEAVPDVKVDNVNYNNKFNNNIETFDNTNSSYNSSINSSNNQSMIAVNRLFGYYNINNIRQYAIINLSISNCTPKNFVIEDSLILSNNYNNNLIRLKPFAKIIKHFRSYRNRIISCQDSFVISNISCLKNLTMSLVNGNAYLNQPMQGSFGGINLLVITYAPFVFQNYFILLNNLSANQIQSYQNYLLDLYNMLRDIVSNNSNMNSSNNINSSNNMNSSNCLYYAFGRLSFMLAAILNDTSKLDEGNYILNLAFANINTMGIITSEMNSGSLTSINNLKSANFICDMLFLRNIQLSNDMQNKLSTMINLQLKNLKMMNITNSQNSANVDVYKSLTNITQEPIPINISNFSYLRYRFIIDKIYAENMDYVNKILSLFNFSPFTLST